MWYRLYVKMKTYKYHNFLIHFSFKCNRIVTGPLFSEYKINVFLASHIFNHLCFICLILVWNYCMVSHCFSVIDFLTVNIKIFTLFCPVKKNMCSTAIDYVENHFWGRAVWLARHSVTLLKNWNDTPAMRTSNFRYLFVLKREQKFERLSC